MNDLGLIASSIASMDVSTPPYYVLAALLSHLLFLHLHSQFTQLVYFTFVHCHELSIISPLTSLFSLSFFIYYLNSLPFHQISTQLYQSNIDPLLPEW
jgi:hypothetical protein